MENGDNFKNLVDFWRKKKNVHLKLLEYENYSFVYVLKLLVYSTIESTEFYTKQNSNKESITFESFLI